MTALKSYYRLTKPGIVYGNVMHAVAGWLFAAAVYHHRSLATLAAITAGTALLVASACIVNNFTDRRIDQKMKRTKTRPSVTGGVSVSAGLILALMCGLAGSLVLVWGTNVLTLVLGLIAYVTYVGPYGYTKRHTWWSTLVGTLPGALPIVAGVTAVSEQLDWLAVGLGLLVTVWQMAHFYAIAMFRKNEYKAAELPIISVVKSEKQVRAQIIMYIWLYMAVIVWMGVARIMPWLGATLLFMGGCYWLFVAYRSSGIESVKWARSVFGVSLILTMLLFAAGVVAIVQA